jgi:hypothetical protein
VKAKVGGGGRESCPLSCAEGATCAPDYGTDTKTERSEGLVEAAGVEPASESTSSWDSTCVSASEFSCPACGSGEVPPGLSLSESRRHAPRRHVPTSLFNGV